MRCLITAALLILVSPVLSWAQSGSGALIRQGEGYVFFGMGPGTDYHFPAASTPWLWHFGLGGEAFFTREVSLGAELGYMGWVANGQAGVGAVDLFFHFPRVSRRQKVDSFVFGGYTPMFYGGAYTGAGNFGAGLNVWTNPRAALRFEARYQVGMARDFAPFQQFLEIRAGLTFK